jgi:PAS domain S-box-containing protein
MQAQDPSHLPDPAKLRLYETILQATPDLLYVFDLQHRFIYANQALLSMWGRTLDDAIGKTCLELGYEPWHAAMHDEEIEQVIATGAPIRGEVPFPHQALGRRIYDYIFTPVFGPDGRVEAIAGATRDVTEHKRHEEHLGLLVNELNHRVKNTLAIVQSMVLQTLRDVAGAEPATERIESRLHALAQAHDLLTRQNWEDACVEEIVRTAIAPAVDAAGRFEVSGPHARLDPRRAVALSMALHELLTNAVKYGALSVPGGHVRIHWACEDAADPPTFAFTWQELDGPPVVAPQRRGFGSRLVERGLRHDLGGDVQLEFAPAGVTCRIHAPLHATPRDADA